MPNCCTVCTNNGSKNKGISFFIYPKDLDRRHQWYTAVGREDLIGKKGDYRICEQHFEEKFIVFSKYRKKKYLSDVAFPSLNIPSYGGTSSSVSQSSANNCSPEETYIKTEDVSIKEEPLDGDDAYGGTSSNVSQSSANNCSPEETYIKTEDVSIKEEPLDGDDAYGGTSSSVSQSSANNCSPEETYMKTEDVSIIEEPLDGDDAYGGTSSSVSQSSANNCSPEETYIKTEDVSIKEEPLDGDDAYGGTSSSVSQSSANNCSPEETYNKTEDVSIKEEPLEGDDAFCQQSQSTRFEQTDGFDCEETVIVNESSPLQIDIKNEELSIKVEPPEGPEGDDAFYQQSQTTRYVQTDVLDPIGKNTSLHLTEDTSRKRKLNFQLEAKKAKTMDLNNVTKEDFLQLCDKFLNKNMVQLIKWQLDLKAGFRGNRNSVAFKFFALKLYYSSRFLTNTLCLPSLPILQKFVTPKGTKIDERLINAIRIKVNKMSPEEKICSVSVDCISVKPNLHYDSTNDRIVGFHDINGIQTPEVATNVVVIMIRGIIHNWKQPVAHSFLAKRKYYPEVNAWIDEIITVLLDIGLDVRVFVTNQGFYLRSAARARSINANKTYFEVKGRKIYYIFDVPHLTRSLLNNFQICNFVYDDKVAKFSDIINMYTRDQKKALRLAPKLTRLHLKPNQKMRMKLAVQVLSNTVAAALKTYVDLNEMDVSALDTANLIKKINRLFDILNSSTLRSPAKFKRAFSGDDSQIDFLQEMLQFFKQLKLVKLHTGIEVTKAVSFINGFQVTTNSVLQLFEDLKSQGIKFIFTRRLNQDALEHFFVKARQAVGNGRTPTCRQVSNTFKKMFVSDILKPPKGNCDDDYDSLMNIDNSNSLFIDSSVISNPQNSLTLDVDTNDYKFDLPEQNALGYVAEYLYKKCLIRHKCDKIEQCVKSENDIYKCKDFNVMDVQSGFLIIPSDNFVRFIELIEKKFRSFFNIHEKITNVGQEVLNYIDDCTFEMPCPCFPIDYLKKLYIRFRIHHTIKINNKILNAKQNMNKNIFRVGNL